MAPLLACLVLGLLLGVDATSPTKYIILRCDGPNEHYAEHSSNCEKTCANMDTYHLMGACNPKIPRCLCDNGYVRNDQGECVRPCECPDTCGENEVHKDCKSICPAQECGVDPSVIRCASPPCLPGCDCLPGYLRIGPGGPCIPEDQCPEKCGENQYFDNCPPGSINPCPPGKCSDLWTRYDCDKFPKECIRQCRCNPPLLRNPQGRCVTSAECIANCRDNEVFKENSTDCPKTCNSTKTGGLGACSPTTGCFCVDGYVRDDNGRCIKRSECPPRPFKCYGNEMYDPCPSYCPLDDCASRRPGFKCPQLPAIPLPCFPRCVCKIGYLRNDHGKCVLEPFCSKKPAKCGPHQVFRKCGTLCPDTCDNLNEPERFCPAVCKSGCFCIQGYVLNRQGLCVLPEECKGKHCAHNEVFKHCRQKCPPQLCSARLRKYKCAVNQPCEPGCDCKLGYLRNDDGICILAKDCPRLPSECRPENHEVYLKCGSACPVTCQNDRTDMGCAAVCVPGCFCKRGYVRDELTGRCHRLEDCPNRKCCKNEVFKKCRTICPAQECGVDPTVIRCASPPCEPGCDCLPGYLRNGTGGPCIPKDQCPGKETHCAYNEVFVPCITICPPQICESMYTHYNCNPPYDCEPGCDCIWGHLRDEMGNCIPIEKCLDQAPEPPQCRINEEYNDCGTECERTCETKDDEIRCRAVCKPGCFCLPGFVRRADGLCTIKDQCDPPRICSSADHEVYQECGSFCPDSCALFNTDRVCTLQCVPGCFCEEGYVRDSNGKCVLTIDCKPREWCSLENNEIYLECGSDCPDTCANFGTGQGCGASCVPGCFCQEGYVRDEITGLCLLSEQCPSRQCGPNQVFSNCGTSCPETCDTLDKQTNRICTYECRIGCVCVPGYVLNNKGECVLPQQCPQNQCGVNEEYSDCGTACPKTCENKDEQIKCIALCVEGCFCLPGYVRNDAGACVRPEHCPCNQCGTNEVYRKCHNLCPPQTCESIYTSYLCVQPQPCEPGCDCIKGYLRNKSGICVPSDQCPGGTQPQTCNENEEYKTCGTACPKTCANKDAEIICTDQCVEGCFCLAGYVRNDAGACVLPELCPVTNPCNDPNEEFLTCGTACPDTCENYKSKNKVCTQQCVVGCFCRNGFVRRKDGVCVYPEECDSPRLCTGVNEEYSDCGTACPKTCKNKDAKIKCIALCKKGCFCFPDYVRNDKGVCVKPSQCPGSQQCGKYEVRVNCRTLCPPQICQSKYALYKCVTPQPCEPGCDCIKGYLRNKSGVCIPSDQCPSSNQTCGPNEVHSPCRHICPPQTCESIYTDYSCLRPQPCEPGCDCATDYLRNKSGVCIPADQCPGAPQTCGNNEQYDTCGTACQKTCKNKDIKINCIAKCVVGCFCLTGYVRNELGACVKPEQCPATNQCKDPKEVFLDCGSSCPDTCDNYNDKNRICTLQCVRGCFCLKGYVRRRNDGKCVLPSQCPPSCDPRNNEVYKECGTACPDTCENYGKPRPCTKNCVSGCFCASGFVRRADGACVLPDQCPKQCRKNEVYKQCGTACPATCDNPNPRLCTWQCVPGCFCVDGLVRDANKNCIPLKQCPVKSCPANERYVPCVVGLCIPKKCTERDEPVPCPDIIGPCAGGCVCEEGFLRDQNGKCIPENHCPPKQCPTNEMYVPCVAAVCRPKYCSDLGKVLGCPGIIPPCPGGCICVKGYLRNDYGTCVPQDECPPPTCGKNEQYDKCGTGCPKTCKNKDIKINCIDKCVKGCFCLPGYVRNEQGACVLPEQCPAPNQCKDPKEVFLDCGSSCPDTCDNYNDKDRICTLQCVPGCFCQKGYVRRRNDGKCVLPSHCPPSCDPLSNEVYRQCGTACPDTCENYGKPRPCTKNCVSGCFCASGFVRRADGACVLPKQCPPVQCGKNEVIDYCPSPCHREDCSDKDNQPTTCNTLVAVKCEPRCVCAKNHFRNNGICVPYEECPGGQEPCNGDPNAIPGCQDCKKTCASLMDPPRRPLPDCPSIDGCHDHCMCKKGYVKDELTGLCVLPERCSKINCGTNQVFDPCAYNCSQTAFCPVDDKPRHPCSPPFVCNAGCVCKPGYLININGDCIPAKDCPPIPTDCDGDPNAIPGCQDCKKTCASLMDPPRRPLPDCPSIDGCHDHCMCKDPFVKDESTGLCVLPERCSNINCGLNQMFDLCAYNCSRTAFCPVDDEPRHPCSPPFVCNGGCVCKPGYLININGDCIPAKDCPPIPTDCDGDPNAIPGCQDCKKTCASLMDPPRRPLPDCPSIDGCHDHCMCKDPFVKDESTGLCVLPERCSNINCGLNQVFDLCAYNCSRTAFCPVDDEPRHPCSPPFVCNGGCVCKPGYLININGDCIPANKCPKPCRKNEVYKQCGTACPATCDNPNPTFCTRQCVAGCFCVDGLVRDANKNCIPLKQCPPMQCGKNEVIDYCPSPCHREDCSDKDNQPTTCNTLVAVKCKPRCICAKNHFRKNGICVPYEECPPIKCQHNEVYVSCVLARCKPKFCSQRGKPVPCPRIRPPCPGGCVCKDGWLRDDKNNNCVPENECPSQKCPKHEVYVDCVIGQCKHTHCSQVGQPIACPSIVGHCAGGCICEPGYLRDARGTCIPENQCRKCPPYSEYHQCMPYCTVKRCDQKDDPPVCIPEHNCTDGCVCIKGYLRDAQGNCIPEKDCPSRCGPNAKYLSCKPHCVIEKCSQVGKPLECSSEHKCVAGCTCIEDYLRDYQGVCVPKDQCPKNTCTDPNAEPGCADCTQTCKAIVNPPRICPRPACRVGDCKCIDGYFNDTAKGICVRPEQCSNINCTYPKVFARCAFNCESDFCPKSEHPPAFCSPPYVCAAGCKCRFDHRIDEEGNCIPTENCPPFKCTRQNEMHSPCPSPCHRERCEDRGKPKPICHTLVKNCIPKCVCKKNHWRNAEGLCVPADECQCPENEVYSNCSHSCPPRTCAAEGKKFFCPLQNASNCKQGCVCQEGYLRDSNGKCIRKEDCRKCPPYSEYHQCMPYCTVKRCDQKDDPPVCIPEHNCTDGCVCIKGYLRDAQGNCIPEKDCPSRCGPNAKYLSCKPHCVIEKCSQVGKPLECSSEHKCVAGCTCIEDYLRDYQGVCVPKDQCPKNTCTDPNAEPGCADCTQTCKAIVNPPRICPRPACRVGDCKCIDGYFNDTAKGICVRPEQCSNINCTYPKVFARCAFNCGSDFCPKSEHPPAFCSPPYVCAAGCKCRFDHRIDEEGNCIPTENCPPFKCTRQNEMHSPCPSPCHRERCEDRGKPKPICHTLVKNCIPKCVCKNNHWRNAEGLCVPADECQCPENEVYSNCSHSCPPQTCAAEGKIFHCPLQNASNCKKGCVCRKGYLRNSNGKCIRKEDCPPQCPHGEVYNSCGSACIATCANRGQPQSCTQGCLAGCFCAEGMYRNDENKCVNYDNCTCNGDPNTKPGCGIRCGNTCADYGKNETRICPLACNLFGCDCREGYIYDDITGKCVLPQDCTKPTQCPKGEIYKECGTACPYTCENRGAVGNCSKECVSGCFCPDKYYRNDKYQCVKFDDCTCKGDPRTKPGCGTHCGNTCADHAEITNRRCPIGCSLHGCDCRKPYVYDQNTGKCVTVEECSPQCGANEKYQKCGTACPLTCDNYKTPPPCIAVCVEGCFCRDGYVRAYNNTCIRKENCPYQCPEGEVYNRCGTACPKTCDNYDKPIGCTKQCVPGCYCRDGQVRDKNNKCIDPKYCPKIGCKDDPNAHSGCGSKCGKSCTDYNGPPKPCPLICRLDGCDCNDGYVYDEVQEICVKPPDCWNVACKGDPNAVLKKCPKPCPATCFRPEINCLKACEAIGCECKHGYVLGPNRKCIRPDQCPANQCPHGEVYDSCGTACPKTCDRYDKSCTEQCVPGCYCRKWQVRDENGKCIDPKDCPKTGCKNDINAIVVPCPPPCPGTCNHPEPIPCKRACEAFGCRCKRGYVIGPNGKCIPLDQCSAYQCPEGEVYNRCGTACPKTCDNYDKPIGCTKQCVPGCYCRDGQVRDKNNKCIDPKYCPKIGCKDDPNAHSGCGSKCGKSCTDYNGPPKACPLICRLDGCDCNDGYVYDEVQEICVKPPDCSNVACKGDPNAVLKKCPKPCPATCFRPEINCLKACEAIGCECKDGYVLGPNGKCIQPDQCPAHECPPHQKYAKCAVRCPTDQCPINEGPFPICDPPFPCPGGCVCDKGYKLDRYTKQCIPVSNCPPVKCRKDNEVFTFCSSLCHDDSCANRKKPAENCGTGCGRMRCVCKPGYYRNDSGDCVQERDCPNQCPHGEVYDSCGTACPKTCDRYDKSCTAQCVPGCYCRIGQVRDENGKCIDPKDCPKTGCKNDINAIVVPCPPPCPGTCNHPEPIPCKRACEAFGCRCKRGYVIGPNGKCIPLDQCSENQCPHGEVYDSCGTACPKTCDRYDKSCTAQCVPGCYCRKWQVRDENGKCIDPKDCPKTGCKNDINAIVVPCPHPCPGNCNHPEPIPCEIACKAFGCQCKEDYVVGPNGKCIRRDQCPGGNCGGNQTYTPCVFHCPTQDCRKDNGPVPQCLPPPREYCKPGCVCLPGYKYVRNSNRTRCVLESDCPKPCPAGEVHDTCGTACPDTCDNYEHPRACTEQCVDGCFCPKGQVRNENWECVDPKDCPRPCPVGEVHDTCGTACPDTCDNYKQPRPCTKQCVNGCFCPEGQVRNKHGKCVYPKDCKPCKDPNAIVVKCPDPCPGTCNHPKKIDCRKACKLFGCQCQRGYVVGPKGKCMRFSKCPGKVCGKNERPTDCLITCPPQRCGVDPRLIKCAQQPCEPGCECLPGYLRNAAGECIPKHQCPGEKCKENEIYTKCKKICPPQYCGVDPRLILCGKPPCVPGCDCVTGYLRNKNHTCIPEQQCPGSSKPCDDDPNAVKVPCPAGPAPCPGTCDNPKPFPCKIACIKFRCHCKKGYVIGPNNKCIRLDECPGKKCGGNQTYAPCGFHCPTHDCPKDEGPVPQCRPPPPEYCKPGCICLPGYKFVRNSNRTRCVRESDCPPIKCSQEKEEIYSKCPRPGLDESCENRNKPKPCSKDEGCDPPRCICRKGYYRNPEGQCVPPCDCPPPSCPANETFNPCAYNCPPRTCDARDKSVVCPNPSCEPGCQCDEGFLRNSYGVCVLEQDCPPKCPVNEEYSYCYSNCPPRTCEAIGKEYDCPEQNCSQGCVCIRGHSRDSNGFCIPSDKCPNAKCHDPNEEFANCGLECPVAFCPINDEPLPECLPASDCRPGCVCAFNHRRDRNRKCIPTYQCPPVNCTRPNELFDACPSPCLQEGCHDQPWGCEVQEPVYCNPRCVCAEGHLRNSDGICVRSDQCGARPGPGPILYNNPRRAPIPINPPDEPYNDDPTLVNSPDETYNDDSITNSLPDEPQQ